MDYEELVKVLMEDRMSQDLQWSRGLPGEPVVQLHSQPEGLSTGSNGVGSSPRAVRLEVPQFKFDGGKDQCPSSYNQSLFFKFNNSFMIFSSPKYKRYD